MKKLLTLLLFFNLAFGESIIFKGCFKGYYFFIPIIENCITYIEDGNTGKFLTDVHTIGIAKVFKDLKYTGIALSEKDKSKKFFFKQKEKNLTVEYWYEFNRDKILTKKTVRKGSVIKRKQSIVPNEEGYLDPFIASVVLFKTFDKKPTGYLKIFFDGKKYKIPYKVSGKDTIKLSGKRYRCYVVELKPEVKGEGLLKTKGKWKVWIDEKTHFPVKVKAVFDKGIIYLKRN